MMFCFQIDSLAENFQIKRKNTIVQRSTAARSIGFFFVLFIKQRFSKWEQKYGDDYVRFVVLSRLSKGKRSLLWSHSCSWRAVGDEEGVHPELDNVVREFVFSRLKKNLAGCFYSSCNPVEVRGFWGASVFDCRSQDLTGNEGEGEAQGRRGIEVETY